MTLYGAVGASMALFARAAFRLRVEGELELGPGTLYVVTHRSHLDVPVLCGALYPRARRQRQQLPWFAVRDDLFLPGFFAHLAPGRLPLRLGIGAVLERRLCCVPVRPSTRMRLVDLCRAQPALPLAELPHADELRARAVSAGLPKPRLAGDVLASRYADVLWRLVEREEVPAATAAWELRLGQARFDLERLIGLLRNGESLVVFPEGTPSRDGLVGPVRRGTRLLVRRGRPRRIVPIVLEYEQRPRRKVAVVRVGPAVPPPRDDVEERVRELLRATAGEVARAPA